MNYLKNQPILFYDGECGFCNWSVQFSLKKRKRKLYYLSLQSEKAKTILKEYRVEVKLDTIYLLIENKLYDKSSAVLRTMNYLKFPFPLLKIFLLIPKPIRNWSYNLISKNRHLFIDNYCVIPSDENKKYFLD